MNRQRTAVLVLLVTLLGYSVAITSRSLSRLRQIDQLKPEASKNWRHWSSVAQTLRSFQRNIDALGVAGNVDHAMSTSENIGVCFDEAVQMDQLACIINPTRECRLSCVERMNRAMPERYMGTIPESLRNPA